jgi:hypothetical protein
VEAVLRSTLQFDLDHLRPGTIQGLKVDC